MIFVTNPLCEGSVCVMPPPFLLPLPTPGYRRPPPPRHCPSPYPPLHRPLPSPRAPPLPV